MLVPRDFDLNYVEPMYNEYLKEDFKQKILSQEALFRNQVHELHRLYYLQKQLLPTLPFMDPTNIASTSKAGSTQNFGDGKQERVPSKPLNLQLQETKFIRYSFDINVPVPEAFEFCLSLGDDSRSSNTNRIWLDKKSVSASQTVVEFERPTGVLSNGNTSPATSLNQSCEAVEICLIIDDSDEAYKDQHNDTPNDSLFIEKNEERAANVDYSQVQVDDSSCNSNELVLKVPENNAVNLALLDFNNVENQVSHALDTSATEYDRGSSNSTESKHSNKDLTDVEIAAEALIHMSNLDNFSADKKSMKPQWSLDSYELIVLNIAEESKAEEIDTASSNPIEVNETEESREFSKRFRRGRRMKDFQKEILPSLASLTRQEICEDMNIFESVMRSREYKKMRAEMGDKEEDWYTPARSKRSRR